MTQAEKDSEEESSESRRKRKKILLLTDLSQNSMPPLYSLSSALVIPSKGEGWGRPHMEAMSCGTPVIATNWSGPTAYLTARNGYPLPVDRMVSAASSGWNGHRWAEASEESLRALMRRVHNRPEEALEKGRQARKDILEHFSLEDIAIEIREHLERLTGVWRGSGTLSARGQGEL